MSKHRAPGNDTGLNFRYEGRHVDTARQPSVNTARGRLIESLPDSAHGDPSNELDRGGRYDRS